ncbi:SDR family NAD(P)-dependent oxidoreductase [Streptomyces sp. JV176]|uniref:type I polyketide synthase n=1 Tax=Streptomyces sp. JV176 TaxID=858630 RepID=UPI002E76585C|nr:SDR family NAD(P)-dependent oxidoreductase [Streptomyces sp. JV176]MEE1798326.1 SDR family NAD(P)-dependent oxidoreductase [Streptomyces sp. JV176]
MTESSLDRGPIAVVGVSCRLPHAANPAAFWTLLRDGVDAISTTPATRWDVADGPGPDAAGTGFGGYLEGIDLFDAAFFGIAPREAAAIDPQQRLMLELSWEALEDAGIVPDQVRGARVGMFAGANKDDYAALLHRRGLDAITAHSTTGVQRGMIANRVSYTLGLSGPSITVDTAQSSSLVAVHLACESLRRGECSSAIVGGVILNFSPHAAVELSRFGGLSPDGRCFTFDARANGFVRGEGGAVVVLKPLRQALADGDRVYCLIRGSAVNNDGVSDGLTVPSAAAQEEVIRRAHEHAGVTPADVQYVELHGTGTRVGDPVEATALGAALGEPRRAQGPLRVGSVKTNIGHLESAAGIAGLLKVVLAIRHRRIPPSLNFREPNPQISLTDLNLHVQTETGAWPDTGRPLVAGVSSFGMGGTNCHVVVSETTGIDSAEGPVEPEDIPAGGAAPWLLSAKSAEALREQAVRLGQWAAARPETDPVAVGRALVTSRSVFEHRAVVVADDAAGFVAGLQDFETSTAVVRGMAAPAGLGPVFVFPGQGAQWVGMGLELWDSEPVFGEWMERCAAALEPFVDWSLREALGDAALLARVDVVQPVSWAVMVSLAGLWRSAGVSPAVVVGHSQGEIAAATASGGLSLVDAARVVALRSQAIVSLAGSGGMVSVRASLAQVEEWIAPWPELSVAAVNGPSQVVVSGAAEACDEFVARYADDGVRRIAVDYASHSSQVKAIEARLAADLAGLEPTSSQVPFHSTLEAALVDTAGLDGGYWYRNLREQVRFAEVIETLVEAGHRTFVEVSAHPVLAMAVEQAGENLAVTGTLRRDDGGRGRWLRSLAGVHVAGVPVDWTTQLGEAGRIMDLPTYAFQRKPYWLPDAPAVAPGRDTSPGTELDALRYEVCWAPIGPVLDRTLTGRWVVAVPADRSEQGEEDAVGQVVAALSDDRDESLLVRVDPARPETAFADMGPVAGVVSFLPPDVSAGMVSGVPVWSVTTGAADDPRESSGTEYWDRPSAPGVVGGRLELPSVWDATTSRRLRAVLSGEYGEDRLALRSSGVFAWRVRTAPVPSAAPRRRWRPSGTVLLAGGGTGRSAEALVRWLEGGGARVVRGGDLPADPDLTAVLYLPEPDGTSDPEALRRLHEQSADRELSAFVVVSRASAQLGLDPDSHGHAEALIRLRRANSLPGNAVAWHDEDMPSVDGMRPTDTARQIEALVSAVEHDDPSIVVADLSSDLRDTVVDGPHRDERRRGRTGVVAAPGVAAGESYLLELVRTHAAAVLGHGGAPDVDADRSFREQGSDSYMAVELRNRLIVAAALDLPATVLFDYPTPARLAAYLHRRLTGVSESDRTPAGAASAADEPIAIVGMGCRFPGGVDSPEALWELLAADEEGVSEFPVDRGWDVEGLYDPDRLRPGTSYARHGTFLAEAGMFDPEFFGISPREATAMDPQQRLVLETAWEALERAGIVPESLRGSDTGVYVGVGGSDYGSVLASGSDEVDGHVLTGNAVSVASGRVAYTLGLEGPAVTVDTACSSSLVAAHLAAQALRAGECSMALAGGVTVMSTPDMFVEFSRQGGLAADGRCKPFADAADGTGWGEGAGILVLERLSDARRHGHQVLAVLRGSAVNQDGASNGLTAPNGPSQQRVIRAALASARLSPAEVDVVEAHGTGTRLGDPIEAQALLATYGQDRSSDRPLWLGSVKSNIGHTQAAAGVAGVIKMVLAMHHDVLPRTLNVDAPSSQVDWSSGAVQLLTEPVLWQADGRPRRAGVSSFGISGTNAHVIIEEPEPEPVSVSVTEPDETPAVGVVPWLLSARSPQALRDQASRLARWTAEHPEADPVAVGRALTTTRSVFEHRAVALGQDRHTLLESLQAFAEDRPSAGVVTGSPGSGRLAVVFSGQGSQRPCMGAGLAAAFPVFAEVFDEVCTELDRHLPRPIREVIDGEPDLLDETLYTQAGLFAVQVALFRLTASWGVVPEWVAGHSIGELSAAYVAGVWDLADAAAVVVARGRLMQELPTGGAMVALSAGEAEALELIGEYATVGLAAVNGPASTVISGDEDVVLELAQRWRDQGGKARRLRVSHAFHSPLMEPMLASFAQVLEGVSWREPQFPVVSGTPDADVTDPSYWVRHVRDTVPYHDTVLKLREQGADIFLEAGPAGTLSAMATADSGVWLPALRPERDEPETVLSALAGAHAHGADVDWASLLGADGGRSVPLPTYAFQRERYWPALAGVRPGDVRALGQGEPGHRLLGAEVALAGGDMVVLTGRLSLATYPWLADHAVLGSVVLPGTAFVDLAVHAGDRVGCTVVDELTLQAPLLLSEQGGVRVQIRVAEPDEDGRRTVGVFSRTDDDDDWAQHADGVLSTQSAPAPELPGEWPPAGARPVPVDGAYERLAEDGYGYGPAFQGLRGVWQSGADLFAEVALAERTEVDGFGVHPALLDAALHPIGLTAQPSGDGVRLPFAWTGVRLHATGASVLRVRLSHQEDGGVGVEAFDPAGQPVFSADSLRLRPITTAPDASGRGRAVRSLFGVDWIPVADPETTAVEWAWHGQVEGELPAVVVAQVPSSDDLESVQTVTATVLMWLQEWLAEPGTVDSRLVLLTRGAADGSDVAAAAVSGLVRSAQSEHPGRFVLLDLDADADLEAVLPPVVHTDEPEIALRAGVLCMRRLVRAIGAGQAVPDRVAEGTVVITGGTGVLGALLARHLVTAYGVRDLLLLSRRGVDAPGADELAVELDELGARVSIQACDVSDRDAVAAVLAGHAVSGVVHAAGVLDDATVESLTPERLAVVLRAKVDAAWHLHELTRDQDLGLFVVYSSVAATLGSAGQGSYAAANAALDALMHQRRSAGLAGHSLAWGLWEQGSGMTGRLGDADLARWARAGVRALSNEQGLTLFDAAVRMDRSLVVAARLDLATMRAAGAVSSLLSGLTGGPGRRSAATAAGENDLAARLAALPIEERPSAVLELVRAQAATVLGHTSAVRVDADATFRDVGFDSLTAVELRNRLTTVTGLRLPATMAFDYPTSRLLAGFVLAGVLGEQADAAPALRSTAVGALDEPIAIVGMGCRYPGGVTSPEALWELLAAGSEGVTEFPADRGWDVAGLYDPDRNRPGTSYTRHGGFLVDAAEFDAEFFGISPREAVAMDPQQRLVLETAWEALERAGIVPDSLRGSATGVYLGLMYHDYATQTALNPGDSDGFNGTGNYGSVLTGRVSYALGLEGPAVTVDTACSSSLVTVHLAAQALRSGECSMALAGGVTVMSTPEVFVEFSRQGGLAADGRCKAFSEAADGTSWGEGAGVLVLERLSDARRHGHQVLAVLRGSAVNQDGASNGLTAPNGPSQQRVIRAALASARLSPAEVDVVEAHGTGTRLGDPIEAQALLATYGQDRPEERPLWLGSVKSNIGHTQAAAGVAGIIKMVLAMRHGLLPRTLHVTAPSSHVDWSAGAVQLLTEPVPWQVNGHPRRAGVSSFGISGTNAHLILEEPESASAVEPDDIRGGVVPWLLSAKSPEALRAQAVRLGQWVADQPEVDPVMVGRALATGRSVFEHRAVVLGRDRQTLVDGVHAVAEGRPGAGAVTGSPGSDRLALVFSGQGSQRPGMGAGLAAAFPVFAEAFDEVCTELDRHLPRPIREVIDSEPDLLDETLYTQAGLFAVQVALYRLTASWGVVPEWVAGHSIGELSAAYVAGVWDLADAAAVVVARGRLMQELPSGGAMVALSASEAEALELIGEHTTVGLAAVNGPASTVISGTESLVEELAQRWRDQGGKARRLRVSHAFHSPLMEPMLDAFARVLEQVTWHVPRIPVVSGIPDADVTDPSYWVRHVRGTVRYHDTVLKLREHGADLFLEAGPAGTLSAMATVDSGVWLPAMRAERDEPDTLLTAVAGVHVHGSTVDWTALLGTRSGNPVVSLPTYAFQRERFWREASQQRAASVTDGLDAEFWEAVEREDASAVLPVLASLRQRQARSAVDRWRYRVGWSSLPERSGDLLGGVWAVLAAAGAGDDLAALLTGAGAEVVRVDLDQVDGRELPEAGSLAGAVVVAGEGRECAAQLLAVAQAWSSVPLWVLTRGAVSVGESDPVVNAWQGQVWGLGRVIGSEQPGGWAGLIDLPAGALDELLWQRCCSVLAGGDGENQVAVRSDGVYGMRLRRAQVAPGQGWRPSGTVLVTGGTGALGARVSRWLVERGAEHLVLVSRRGADAPGAQELAAELSASGVGVQVAAGDVADRVAMAEVLAAIPEEFPLTAVVHTAGVLDDGVLGSLTPQRLEAVAAPKVDAVLALDELTADMGLHAFVLFSSAAALLGSPGQGNYAAANGFLDAYAQMRRAQGAPMVSMAWGAWAGAGLADSELVQSLHRRVGVGGMDPAVAVMALEHAVDDGYVAVADVDWGRVTELGLGGQWLAELPEAKAVVAADAVNGDSPWLLDLRQAPPGKGPSMVLSMVREQAATVLGHANAGKIDEGAAFRSLGFDSLTAVELRNRMAAVSGLSLPAALVFDYPTPADLAGYLHTRLSGDADAFGPSILDELSRLENSLSALTAEYFDSQAADVGFHDEVSGRLKALTSTWHNLQGQNGDGDVQDQLQHASDDDLFDFIDNRYGKA